MVSIELYRPTHLDSVRRHLTEIYGAKDPAYYPWRFEGCPGVATFLAMSDDGTCAAVLSRMRKIYRIGGEPVEVNEIFDWTTDARFKGQRLGQRVMQAVMDEGLPVFALGGSTFTQHILVPKMGFQPLVEARAYAFPLRGRFVASRLGSRGKAVATVGGLAFSAAGRAWFRPRRARGLRIEPVTGFAPDLVRHYDADRVHGLIATMDPKVVDWMANGLPRPGQYLRFEAIDQGRVRAWGLAAIRVTPAEITGEILDLHGSPPDPDVYAELIREMTACLAGFGVDAVVSTATSPVVQAALRACRFVGGHSHAVIGYHKAGFPPFSGPLHVMRGTADHPVVPVPTFGER